MLETTTDLQLALTNLDYYKDKKVEELYTLDPINLSDGKQIRHYLYSLLTMSINHHFWNGNKNGVPVNGVEYPLNIENGSHDSYLGHNICALAVDGNGKIIDYEFNNNKIFKSSVEHAETRLVKRIYSLSQLQELYKISNKKKDEEFKKKDEANTFDEVSIYTTLESCSQCSGVMALAKVKEIIYLQEDPGMYKVGNILRNLTKQISGYENNNLESPQPIPGFKFGFRYKESLEKGYIKFNHNQTEGARLYKEGDKSIKPFNINNGEWKYSNSMTSYLCTKEAFEIYDEARKELESLINNIRNKELIKGKFKKILNRSKYNETINKKVEDKDFITDILNYKPTSKNTNPDDIKSNFEVLIEIMNFWEYVKLTGSRGTQHR